MEKIKTMDEIFEDLFKIMQNITMSNKLKKEEDRANSPEITQQNIGQHLVAWDGNILREYRIVKVSPGGNYVKISKYPESNNSFDLEKYTFMKDAEWIENGSERIKTLLPKSE